VHLQDQIFDFETGIDKLDLSAIDADTTTAGNQAFTFVQFPSGFAAGQATIVNGGSVTHVYLDVDGGGYDMQIDVYGTFDPTADVAW
jgi:serralysin